MKKINAINVLVLSLLGVVIYNLLKRRKVSISPPYPQDETKPFLVNPAFTGVECESPDFSELPDLTTDCGNPPLFDAEPLKVSFGDYSCDVLFVQQQVNLIQPDSDLIEDGKFGCQTLFALRRLDNSNNKTFIFREFFRKNQTTNTAGNWLGSGTQKLEVNRFLR